MTSIDPVLKRLGLYDQDDKPTSSYELMQELDINPRLAVMLDNSKRETENGDRISKHFRWRKRKKPDFDANTAMYEDVLKPASILLYILLENITPIQICKMTQSIKASQVFHSDFFNEDYLEESHGRMGADWAIPYGMVKKAFIAKREGQQKAFNICAVLMGMSVDHLENIFDEFTYLSRKLDSTTIVPQITISDLRNLVTVAQQDKIYSVKEHPKSKGIFTLKSIFDETDEFEYTGIYTQIDISKQTFVTVTNKSREIPSGISFVTNGDIRGLTISCPGNFKVESSHIEGNEHDINNYITQTFYSYTGQELFVHKIEDGKTDDPDILAKYQENVEMSKVYRLLMKPYFQAIEDNEFGTAEYTFWRDLKTYQIKIFDDAGFSGEVICDKDHFRYIQQVVASLLEVKQPVWREQIKEAFAKVRPTGLTHYDGYDIEELCSCDSNTLLTLPLTKKIVEGLPQQVMYQALKMAEDINFFIDAANVAGLGRSVEICREKFSLPFNGEYLDIFSDYQVLKKLHKEMMALQ